MYMMCVHNVYVCIYIYIYIPVSVRTRVEVIANEMLPLRLLLRRSITAGTSPAKSRLLLALWYLA